MFLSRAPTKLLGEHKGCYQVLSQSSTSHSLALKSHRPSEELQHLPQASVRTSPREHRPHQWALLAACNELKATPAAASKEAQHVSAQRLGLEAEQQLRLGGISCSLPAASHTHAKIASTESTAHKKNERVETQHFSTRCSNQTHC